MQGYLYEQEERHALPCHEKDTSSSAGLQLTDTNRSGDTLCDEQGMPWTNGIDILEGYSKWKKGKQGVIDGLGCAVDVMSMPEGYSDQTRQEVSLNATKLSDWPLASCKTGVTHQGRM